MAMTLSKPLKNVKKRSKPGQKSKATLPLAAISYLPLDQIRPSPENETLYKPIDPWAPDIVALANEILKDGILDELHVTRDGFIVDGHRRYAAAKQAGLGVVPCIILDYNRDDDLDHHVKMLASYNRQQRVKSFDEQAREIVVGTNPQEANEAVIEYRRRKADVFVEGMDLGKPGRRSKITRIKKPMLEAVLTVIREREDRCPAR